jgi:multidrug efflux system membrane fusion protein
MIRGKLIAAAMSLLVTVAFAGGCGSDGGGVSAATPAERPPAVPVTVASVMRRDVPLKVRAIGNVEAYRTVSVRSQVDGQLAEVHFKEGGEVATGDLLFTIDPRPFEAALRAAEANLARDEAQRNNAEVEAKRLSRLLEQGFASADEADQVKTRAAAMNATVKADEAAVENARLRLQYCYVRSPIDGRLGQLLVNVGNVVKNNDTILAVVNQIRPVYVAFSVPEQELLAIRSRSAADALPVEATLPGGGGRSVTGSLTFIDNAVDTKTGTVLLKGLFQNEDEVLWPGLFVDVALVLGIDREVVVAPGQAIQTGQQGQYAFVVKSDHTVEARNVVVGRSEGEEVLITSGLEAGEQVVTDGQLRLAPGLEVQIRESPAGAAAEKKAES